MADQDDSLSKSAAGRPVPRMNTSDAADGRVACSCSIRVRLRAEERHSPEANVCYAVTKDKPAVRADSSATDLSAPRLSVTCTANRLTLRR